MEGPAPGRANPGPEAAVPVADPVPQECELHRLQPAIARAGHADPVAVRDALIDQLPEQVLRVAQLKALVGEVEPAPVAGRRGPRRRHAARAPEPARGVVDDGVAVLRVVDVVVVVGLRARWVPGRVGRLEARLRAGEAVEDHDRRERPGAVGGQRHVDVERHAVEASDSLRVGDGRAEADAVLRRARVAERALAARPTPDVGSPSNAAASTTGTERFLKPHHSRMARQRSYAGVLEPFRSRSASRSSTRRILPVSVFGRSSTNSTSRG